MAEASSSGIENLGDAKQTASAIRANSKAVMIACREPSSVDRRRTAAAAKRGRTSNGLEKNDGKKRII